MDVSDSASLVRAGLLQSLSHSLFPPVQIAWRLHGFIIVDHNYVCNLDEWRGAKLALTSCTQRHPSAPDLAQLLRTPAPIPPFPFLGGQGYENVFTYPPLSLPPPHLVAP